MRYEERHRFGLGEVAFLLIGTILLMLLGIFASTVYGY